MHRQPLLALLERYTQLHPQERVVERFTAFVNEHPDCLERTCVLGHITASAWIVSPDGTQALLTHHRKLDRWLQLGGHVDGESDVVQAALREAQEESGIDEFDVLAGTATQPLDLDIHRIPDRGAEPAHDHLDVRFLLRAKSEQLQISDESNDLRWFPLDEVRHATEEESVLRLGRKAVIRLAE